MFINVEVFFSIFMLDLLFDCASYYDLQIHSKVLSNCRWNRHYKALAWRVDLRSACMRDADVNEPIALFEFASQSGLKSPSDPERKVARFQMNRKQVGDMLTTLEGIKKKIEDANVST